MSVYPVTSPAHMTNAREAAKVAERDETDDLRLIWPWNAGFERCPGQGSNNPRFYREIKRFRKRRCKKRCNRPGISQPRGKLALVAGDNQIGDPSRGTPAPGQGVDEALVLKAHNREYACWRFGAVAR
jgi:hypothetical protein